MKRLVVMISGNGSNLQALIDATQTNVLDAKIVAVVSNRHSAYGLERAKQARIPTFCFPLESYLKANIPHSVYDANLAAHVSTYRPDLIILAGWMHILGPNFLDRFADRVLNVHPALPGQFPGVNAIKRAYQAYQDGTIEFTGVMVHRVVPEVDAGPVVLSDSVMIYKTDTFGDLEDRVHAVEHRLIVEAVQAVTKYSPPHALLKKAIEKGCGMEIQSLGENRNPSEDDGEATLK